MRIVAEHAAVDDGCGDGTVLVHVCAVGVAGILLSLPQDRRRAIQLLDALLDHLPAAVDAALGVGQ